MPHKLMPLSLKLLLLLTLVLATPVRAEQAPEPDTQEAATNKATAAENSLQTLSNLLAAKANKQLQLKALKRQLSDKQDEASKAKALREEITASEAQITALATGVSETEFNTIGDQSIDLQKEFQQLVVPFVMMLRNATDNARQIDSLRRQLAVAERQKAMSKSAVLNIQQLLEQPAETDVHNELRAQLKTWEERLANARDLLDSTTSLLDEKMNPQFLAPEAHGGGLSAFFVGRGLSLVIGVSVFLAVLIAFQLVRWLAGKVMRSSRYETRGFWPRLVSLFFNLVSIIAAAVAMLTVFNIRNDWVLLGISIIAMIALAWFVIKSLPSLISQAVLYLNVGAVQEGERVMLNGIPWMVQKLSFQSKLVNPALAFGEFTVPIGELVGLHSRPTDYSESWFPTQQGDWVKLEGGVGEITYQTPSMVEVKLRGGALQSFATADFFAAPPTNFSSGVRVEVVFGISYKHQAEATTKIPAQLSKFVHVGLSKLLPEAHILAVNVETMAAGSSSIDLEVEADLSGHAAGAYESVQRALIGLCIDACNHYGWEIPFPQLVLHQHEATQE